MCAKKPLSEFGGVQNDAVDINKVIYMDWSFK